MCTREQRKQEDLRLQKLLGKHYLPGYYGLRNQGQVSTLHDRLDSRVVPTTRRREGTQTDS